MLKLKKIIGQLGKEESEAIEKELLENKAQNFLFLYKSYQASTLSDQEIMDELDMNSNAFYVMKSRLHEKIQQHLIGNKEIDKQEILRQLSNITQYCFDTPRETAVAILLKLEKDLKSYDLPADLTAVYSTLKKLHLNSSKYFHYSQLYNKHLAYAMVLEKAEDLLGNFARTLSLYFFSRSQEQKDMLLLIKREIDNIYALNNAHRIHFIKNLITLQSFLFCDIEYDEEEPAEDLLAGCEEIISRFPNDSYYYFYSLVIDFLKFQYYRKIGQMKKAMPSFDRVNAYSEKWLLYGNTCLAYHFLFSKIEVYAELGKQNELAAENEENGIIYDREDTNTEIAFKLYQAVSLFYAKRTKESISLLNDALNLLNTKDGLHMEMELKCTLAYFYLVQDDYDMAGNLLRSMYRKLNAMEDHPYENVLDLSRLLNLLMNNDSREAQKQKTAKSFKMFEQNNSGEHRLLSYLGAELKKFR